MPSRCPGRYQRLVRRTSETTLRRCYRLTPTILHHCSTGRRCRDLGTGFQRGERLVDAVAMMDKLRTADRGSEQTRDSLREDTWGDLRAVGRGPQRQC